MSTSLSRASICFTAAKHLRQDQLKHPVKTQIDLSIEKFEKIRTCRLSGHPGSVRQDSAPERINFCTGATRGILGDGFLLLLPAGRCLTLVTLFYNTQVNSVAFYDLIYNQCQPGLSEEEENDPLLLL